MAGSRAGAMKRAAAIAGVTPSEYQRRSTDEKWCYRCREWHPRSAFNVDTTRSDGLDPSCATSRAAYQRGRYTKRGRTSTKGRFFAATRAGDKLQARARVNHRVARGVLANPNTIACADCGHLGSDRRHEYDHHLGYDADHQLDVEAVCTRCHHAREEARRG